MEKTPSGCFGWSVWILSCLTLTCVGETVTSRTTQHDRVLAFDAGADDYVAKPFEWEEFLARIRALLRRSMAAEGEPRFADGEIALISSAEK